MTLVALRTGVAVPFLYFGTQFIAALFYPGYSFLTMDASTLGSDRSTFPLLLNAGVIATGLATLVAAFGLMTSLKQQSAGSVKSWAVFFALVQNGLATIWAGFFSLPDSRHNIGILGVIGLLVLPPLLMAAMWRWRDFGRLKTYLIVTCVFGVALIPVMSGSTGIDTRQYGGLLQRVAAAILFSPIAIVAHSFAARMRAVAS